MNTLFFYRKQILILILILYNYIPTFCQFSTTDLYSFPLGILISDSQVVKNRFKLRPSIYKGDFLNAYRICYENSSFDYYGKSEYTFQFVKDSLSSIDITFFFNASQLSEFERFLKTFTRDLVSNPNFEKIKMKDSLKIQDILLYAKKECKYTVPKSDPNYVPVKSKFMGYNTYLIKNKESHDLRYIMVFCSLTEAHKSGAEGNYDGGKIEISIILTNHKMSGLWALEGDLNVMNYTEIRD